MRNSTFYSDDTVFVFVYYRTRVVLTRCDSKHQKNPMRWAHSIEICFYLKIIILRTHANSCVHCPLNWLSQFGSSTSASVRQIRSVTIIRNFVQMVNGHWTCNVIMNTFCSANNDHTINHWLIEAIAFAAAARVNHQLFIVSFSFKSAMWTFENKKTTNSDVIALDHLTPNTEFRRLCRPPPDRNGWWANQ